MTNILVLFTCFNRKEKTQNCLNTLSKNKECNFDYIVLDDNSSDGTIDMLKEYNNVTLLIGDGYSFYSGGMRLAITRAKSIDLMRYGYVMFINDDVSFFESAIDRLVECEGGNGEILVGAVCDKNGCFSYGGEIKASKFKPEFKSVKIDDDDLYCDTTCANCVLIPRLIFEKLPNIDTTYHHAMGDFDYFFVATDSGYKIRSSDFYVGQCDDNDVKGGWRDTSLPRLTRLKKKESVKGLPFREWFHYLKKNHSMLTAVIFSLTPYIRIILKR